MKKLIVLAIAMLLVSLGAFAQDVTFSGEVEYKAETDFGTGFEDGNTVEVNLTAVVDDYDTVQIDLEPLGGDLAGSGAEAAYFVSDLGGRFMLPETVGVVVEYGFNEWADAGIAEYSLEENERIIDFDPEGWGALISLTIMDMVNVDVVTLFSDDGGAGTPGGFGSSDTDEDLLIDVYGTIDPVSFQIAYADEVYDADGERAFGAGLLGISAGTELEVATGITVSGGAKFVYDLDAPDAPGSSSVGVISDLASESAEFAYSLVAGAGYMEMVGAYLTFVGFDGSEANNMTIELWANPIELVWFQLIAGIGLDDDLTGETFTGLEAAVELNVGEVDWYFGYIYKPEEAVTHVKDFAPEFPSALELNADPTNEGAFFFGGELKF